MASERGGWVITPAGGSGVNPRVLDTEEVGGAVAETIAALSAATLLQKAPTPADARDAADEVHYPFGGGPQTSLHKAVKGGDEHLATSCRGPESLADVEPIGVSAAEMSAEERAPTLRPPPPAESREVRPCLLYSSYARSNHRSRSMRRRTSLASWMRLWRRTC